MKRLLVTLVTVVFIFLLAAPAFAGKSIVNSLKIPVKTGQEFIYFEPLLDFQLVKSRVKVEMVEESGVMVKVLEKYPEGYGVRVDGDFHVHTKLTVDPAKPSVSVEGSVATLGFEGYDDYKNRYLVKGDYQFNLDLSKFLDSSDLTKRRFFISGIIPLKLIDANSGQDYYVYAEVDIGCDVEQGCTEAGIQFVKTGKIPREDVPKVP